MQHDEGPAAGSEDDTLSAEEREKREVRGGDVSDEEWERQLQEVHPNRERTRRANRSIVVKLLLLAVLGAVLAVGEGDLRTAVVALVGLSAVAAVFWWVLRRTGGV